MPPTRPGCRWCAFNLHARAAVAAMRCALDADPSSSQGQSEHVYGDNSACRPSLSQPCMCALTIATLPGHDMYGPRTHLQHMIEQTFFYTRAQHTVAHHVTGCPPPLSPPTKPCALWRCPAHPIPLCAQGPHLLTSCASRWYAASDERSSSFCLCSMSCSCRTAQHSAGHASCQRCTRSNVACCCGSSKIQSTVQVQRAPGCQLGLVDHRSPALGRALPPHHHM
jgi:hypothetical protein